MGTLKVVQVSNESESPVFSSEIHRKMKMKKSESTKSCFTGRLQKSTFSIFKKNFFVLFFNFVLLIIHFV